MGGPPIAFPTPNFLNATTLRKLYFYATVPKRLIIKIGVDQGVRAADVQERVVPSAERPEVGKSACFIECGSLVDRSSCTEASFVGKAEPDCKPVTPLLRGHPVLRAARDRRHPARPLAAA